MRRFWLTATLLGALATVACGGGGRPPIDPPPGPPPPPICDGRDVVIYTVDPSGNPLAGVTVTSEAQDGDRVSDGSGFSHRWACGSALYRFALEGWHVTNCLEDGSCDLAGPEHRVHLARDNIPDPPTPPPGSHINPVQGAIWSDRNGCFGDDTGCRNFVIYHYGDAPPRWQAGGRPSVLADFDGLAEAGYHIVRMWSHLRPEPPGTPWAHGGDPPYNALDLLHAPDAVKNLTELINAGAERGLRVTLEAGGVDGIGRQDERRLMESLNTAGRDAGAWKVAWFAPYNEPSSVHATSDDDGDNTPGYLRELVDVARAGTNTLWHLGYGHNNDWDTENRFAQKKLTPGDQSFGYYHAWRGGRVTDKIRRRFSWLYEDPGQFVRKWVDGEGVGQPCSGPPLRYVSVTENCHELNAESLSMIVAMQTMRGIGSSMSGNGVQRYQDVRNVVGFREIPWTVRQMHHDVATFTWIHHSGDSHRDKRTLQAQGDVRIDGAKHSDGRFDYVIHGSSGSFHLRAEKSFDARLCDPIPMTCQDVSVNAGGTLPVTFTYGRLLTGRDR
jgi:hypothetical protein